VRFVFNQPSPWSEELIGRLLIWTVALGIVAGFRQGGLVSVDLMLRLSTGRWHRSCAASSCSPRFPSSRCWPGSASTWRGVSASRRLQRCRCRSPGRIWRCRGAVFQCCCACAPRQPDQPRTRSAAIEAVDVYRDAVTMLLAFAFSIAVAVAIGLSDSSHGGLHELPWIRCEGDVHAIDRFPLRPFRSSSSPQSDGNRRHFAATGRLRQVAGGRRAGGLPMTCVLTA